MGDQSFKRRVFWDRADIPKGTKALIINVDDPIFTLIASDAPDEELVIFDKKLAYVEITLDEWADAKDNPEKANALARQFGGLVQKAMGASWHRWHNENDG